MKVYVFGNSFFFVVVIYGLRKIVDIVEEKYGKDMKKFVYFNFYVDDVLFLYVIIEEVVLLF